MTEPSGNAQQPKTVQDDNSLNFTFNVSHAGIEPPQCKVRAWSAGRNVVEGHWFETALMDRAADILRRHRFLIVFAPTQYGELYNGLVGAVAGATGLQVSSASYEPTALSDFRGDVSLTVGDLLRGVGKERNSRCIVANTSAMGRQEQVLLADVLAYAKPATLANLTANLNASNTSLVVIADCAAEDSRPQNVSLEIDPLPAVRSRVLDAYPASRLDSTALDRHLRQGVFGEASVEKAWFLHTQHVNRTLLDRLRALSESDDPVAAWQQRLRGLLVPEGRDPTAVVDPLHGRNDAAIEAIKIVTFIFSTFDSLTHGEFEMLFKLIASGQPTVQRYVVEHSVTPGTDGAEVTRKIVRPVTVGIVEEFKRISDGIFRSLSLGQNPETKRFSFELPYMRQVAGDLFAREFPWAAANWFSHVTMEMPTVFAGTDSFAQQLVDAYVDWLAKSGSQSGRHFSELSWWDWANRIVEDESKDIEGTIKDTIKDEALRKFVSDEIVDAEVRPRIIDRVCMLHRKLLSQDQLRPLVDGDLKDLIARKLWRTAIGVCRALQHERDFDVVYWIFQLLNQGDSGAREEAAALLNRHIDTVQRERSGARALFQRLHEHIAEKGKDTRPSTGIVASSLARLVFHKSARLRRLEADGGPHIAPFFLLDKPVGDSTGLVDEIDAVLAMLLHAPSAEVAAREAGASCEAVLDIWSAVLAGGEMSTPLNDAARSKFTDRLDGALALKDARIAKGITVGLTIVEAFEQLRTIGKRFRGDVSSQGGGGIRAELMDQLHLKLEQDYDVSRIARFKEGMKVAAVAAANLLAGYREPLGGRFDIAQRLERWVGR